jgi:hypothetical protein
MWDYSLDKPLKVTIRDIGNNSVHSGIASGNQWYILNQKLSEGIYVYTIEEGERLLHVGIFFVSESR